MKHIIALLLLIQCSVFASGSVDMEDHQFQKMLYSNETMVELLNNGLNILSCWGTRLGKHWENLGGKVIGPYECEAKYYHHEVIIGLTTKQEFLDENFDLVGPDDQFNAYYVKETLINLEVIEDLWNLNLHIDDLLEM